MNEARRKKLSETLDLLKDRRQQLCDISIEAREKQGRMPETERFYSLRSHLSDASDALDEAESLLGGLIEDTERVLTEPTAPEQPLSKKEKIAKEEMVKDIEAGKPEEKQLSRVGIWWRMFFLFLFTAPLLMLCLWLWIDRNDSVYLWFAGFIFVAAVVILYILMGKWDKTPLDSHLMRNHDTESGIDPATELMAGILGSEILSRELNREREAAEKRRYDSLYWQESIRDKNPRHDFDYDHDDD